MLRVFAYLKDLFKKVRHKQDKIVLQDANYDKFVEQWMKCYYNYNIEITVGYLFRSLAALLENQILRYYVNSMTNQQIKEKKYYRPIKVIDKPKNIEQFTFTENTT